MEKDDKNVVKIKKRHVYLAVMAIAFFGLGFLTNSFSGQNFSGISKSEVGDKTLSFITENFLESKGMDAELVGVEDIGKDLFAVTLSIKNGDQSQPEEVYVTRDGKLILLGQGGMIIDLTEEVEELSTPVAPTTSSTPSETPVVSVSVDDDPSIGPEDASITIIEFSDFQCPICKIFHDETFDPLIQAYGDDIRFVYRDFAFLGPESSWAAQASECADDQGKFWVYQDYLFENWAGENKGTFSKENLKRFASELGLNTDEFDQCLESGKYEEEVIKDVQDGRIAGVTGTPTFYILVQRENVDEDGVATLNALKNQLNQLRPGAMEIYEDADNGNIVVKTDGAQPFSVFKVVIDVELAK